MLADELKSIFRQYKNDNEIYHDLGHYHVSEILLVTSLYDAFVLEEEEKLNERIFGEFYNLEFSTAPRITSVSDEEEVVVILTQKYFDYVIITMRTQNMKPFEIAAKIKLMKPDLPVFLLLYDNSDIALIDEMRDKITVFEKVFVWNRDAKIFLAITEYFEDKLNAENDTKIGLVRVILLVENSIRYYSRYLPVLYNEIIKQTQRLITKDNLDVMKKILRMRARPKVLMAVNYEQAIEIIKKYNDNLLCVISDVKFPHNGKIDEQAGIKLLKYVKSINDDIPFLLQSSDESNAKVAERLNVSFINKNSDTLSADLTDFIQNNLGFGDFIFRDEKGVEISSASSLAEFKKLLGEVPSESILYHGTRNHFSAWLMARGEIQIAEHLQPMKVSDFPNPEAIRNYILQITKAVEANISRGGFVDFDEKFLNEDNLILRLSGGSFGGKGRGIVFINTLLQSKEVFKDIEDFPVKIPRTSIVGTEEFDSFINNNSLNKLYLKHDYEELKRIFLEFELSPELISKLTVYLKKITVPLAVRSSGMYEDSISESFSGIYQTFLIPNNHNDFEQRLKNLTDAIKLVYASVFSKQSRSYFEAINYKIDQEKMAVVIQEVAGTRFGDVFFSHLSGVAQSYNFYPIARFKPEDGIAIAAVGMCNYVIEGRQSFRFCPKYAKVDIESPEMQLKNSQSYLYAIDMTKPQSNLAEGENITLRTLDISEAEKSGAIEETASVWNVQDNKMKAGLDSPGPRIINFAGILKYDTYPVAKILERLLEIVEASMGLPVEIEFAANLGKDNPGFYVLQLKPLIRNAEFISIEKDDFKKEELFLFTEKGMGNGKIDGITDIIYANPDLFDKSKTLEMTHELEKLNNKLKKLKRKYILIGPGRWGTRDSWLGIPVVWTQISAAKIIVETDLKDFSVDASLGSHFFHNITSMNIGYFTVHQSNGTDFIDWKWLKKQNTSETTKHFTHVRLPDAVTVLMDGRKGICLIKK